MRHFIFFVLFSLFTAQSMAWDVRMVWDANPEPDIVKYTVYRQDDSVPSPAFSFLADVPASDLWYVDAGLNTGDGPYSYQITATNAADLESGPSNTITASEPVVIPPQAPNIRVFVVVSP